MKAKRYAFEAHKGDLYGDYPYTKHLNDVYNVLVATGVDDNLILMVAWMHDIIEDTHLRYEDIFEDFGKRTADLVYLVTDKRGKTRSERHQATYPLIADGPRATTIKVADRLANIMNSQHDKEKMFFMYEKEHPYFKETLLTNIEREDFAPFKPFILAMMARIDAILTLGPHMEY